MKIAFIGYGSMATALATKWQHSHQLFFAGRNLEKAQLVAKEFSASSGNSSDAAEFADVVVLATRYEDVFSALFFNRRSIFALSKSKIIAVDRLELASVNCYTGT